MEEAKHHFGDEITYCPDEYDALIDADCLAVLTEWPEFRVPNFNIVKKLMNESIIFDGRNIYDAEEMESLGFDYSCIGVKKSAPKRNTEHIKISRITPQIYKENHHEKKNISYGRSRICRITFMRTIVS